MISHGPGAIVRILKGRERGGGGHLISKHIIAIIVPDSANSFSRAWRNRKYPSLSLTRYVARAIGTIRAAVMAVDTQKNTTPTATAVTPSVCTGDSILASVKVEHK